MSDEQQLAVIEGNSFSLGSVQVSGPHEVVTRAVEISAELAKIIREKKLSRVISGREYVYVEGWTTLAAMLGVVPREVSVIEQDNGDFESVVELVRVSDGAVIGRGSAIVGMDETTWANRPRYARRSMSITRATGKACRLTFSWVMKLAGFQPTPAEEMDEDDEKPRNPVPAAMPTVSARTAKEDKLWSRWYQLITEAGEVGVPVPVLDVASSAAEITKAGIDLAAAINKKSRENIPA